MIRSETAIWMARIHARLDGAVTHFPSLFASYGSTQAPRGTRSMLLQFCPSPDLLMWNGSSLSRKGVSVLAIITALGVAVAMGILLLGPASPASKTTASSPAPARGPCNGWAIVATRGLWPGGASILSH